MRSMVSMPIMRIEQVFNSRSLRPQRLNAFNQTARLRMRRNKEGISWPPKRRLRTM